MRKPELLAPAGDLEKLKIAVLYGADAVFVGSKEFSLRSRASNFTIEDLYEGAKFCHEHNAKLYVTTNIVPHNSDLIGLVDYLQDLENTDNDYLRECQAQKKKIRGLLVAPSIMDDAQELIEEEGIEFVAIEPPRELKRDKKVTLDAF